MRVFYKTTRFLAVFFCLSILVLLFSCTNSKPEITYGFLQLVLYQSDTGPRENYSFFIIAHDDDGIENLDELYLFHDREQLRWQIKSNEWVYHTQDGRNWIGTRSITTADGALPRGTYRAVLVNKAGESTERHFTFDGNVRFPFPEIEVNDRAYMVRSSWPVNRLVCYDNTGNYISTVELQSLSGNLSDLRLSANARSVALWAEDTANFCGAFTNVVPIN
ncbi:MAG: hypothetical protein LBI12_03995 [Treponema sp.]|jgi:hypothetical protein|nr:hypothetical protein [Treponema sp.]